MIVLNPLDGKLYLLPPSVSGGPGANGLSAYQVAVAAGFVGTIEEWLASLVGAPGAPGQSIAIQGSVATAADLPPSSTIGYGYITRDTGHLWVWDGFVWIDAGNVTGPPGPPGPPGISVWRDGHGVPVFIFGSGGYYYLDVDTGDVYKVGETGGISFLLNLIGPPGPPGVGGGGGGNGFAPMSNGENPPSIVDNGAGEFVMVPYE